MLKIGIIGTGYWGKHHLRIFSRLPCELVGIADVDPSKANLAKEYNTRFFTDYKKLLKKVDAVSIVTPPATHFNIAKKALKRGCHVLLEKPFVFQTKEAETLKELSGSSHLILMTGHTYLYHPAVRKIKELIKKDETGSIYYLILQWLNLGIIRKDVNALWNFGPHPFSILHFLFSEIPSEIESFGRSYIQSQIEDAVFLHLKYPGNKIAQVNLSWLHPQKIREVTIVGSKKLVYFNDVDEDTPLKIFDKGISPEEYQKALNWDNFAEFRTKVRYGNIEIPKLENSEPLQLELEDFINSIKNKREPVAGIASALATVKMLAMAEKSLRKGGIPVGLKK